MVYGTWRNATWAICYIDKAIWKGQYGQDRAVWSVVCNVSVRCCVIPIMSGRSHYEWKISSWAMSVLIPVDLHGRILVCAQLQ